MAERANRTLIGTTIGLLFARRERVGLGGEALATAVPLRNKILGRDEEVTPEELFLGKQPFVAFLITFGCKAWVHVPSLKKTKLEPKAVEATCGGYDQGCKA